MKTGRSVMGAMSAAPEGRLLDVGCADGEESIRLQHHIGAATCIGLELADQFVPRARERGVRPVDLTDPWPIEDASIDALHSNQVIEHLAATDHFMREVRRVLEPSGYAVISTNNLASWHNVIALMLGLQPGLQPLPCHVSDEAVVGNPLAMQEVRYGERIHRHLRIFTGKALRELAEAHGLRLEHEVGSGYYPASGRLAQRLARLDRRDSGTSFSGSARRSCCISTLGRWPWYADGRSVDGGA